MSIAYLQNTLTIGVITRMAGRGELWRSERSKANSQLVRMTLAAEAPNGCPVAGNSEGQDSTIFTSANEPKIICKGRGMKVCEKCPVLKDNGGITIRTKNKDKS